jgi:hypothetical protein
MNIPELRIDGHVMKYGQGTTTGSNNNKAHFRLGESGLKKLGAKN